MAWRRTKRGNFIIGSKCKDCSALFFPSRTKCTKCKSEEVDDYIFKGIGEIHSYSIIYFPPSGFERQVPYAIAIIKLEEGLKITGQIVDFEKIELGMKVESCVRKLYVDGEKGIIHYGIKFRPSD